MKLNKGLIHVYTGDGKGKTTAAIGQAVRSAGNGLNVLVLQFFKPSSFPSGERAWKGAKPGNLVYRTLKSKHPLFDKRAEPEAIRDEFGTALNRLKREMARGKWDVIVLDEVNNALNKGFISWPRFSAFLLCRPANVELICTGRSAPEELIQLADYATQMRKLKHPFDHDVAARKGIEF